MKAKKLLGKISLLCCGYGLLSDAVIIPLVTALMTEFPDASQAQISFITSGSFIFSMLASLIWGRVGHRLNKKMTLIVATTVYSIASTLNAAAHSIGFIVAMRAVDGLTDGVVGVTLVLAINDLYTDEKERNQMLGLHWAAVSVYGIALSLLSGALCTFGWRISMFSNVLSFITPVLIALFVPSIPPKAVAPQSVHKTADRKLERLPVAWIILSLIAAFSMNCLGNVFYFTADLYVAERNLGNSVFTGIVTACSTVGGIIAGISFGSCYHRVKEQFPLLLFASAAAATAMLALPISGATVCVMHIIIGAAYTYSLSYYQTCVVERIRSPRDSEVISYFEMIQSLGLAVAAYVPALINQLFGEKSYMQDFPYIAGALAAIAAIYALQLLLKQVQKRNSVLP